MQKETAQIYQLKSLLIDKNTGEIFFELEDEDIPGYQKSTITKFKTARNGEGLWILEKNGNWKQIRGYCDLKLTGTRQTIRRNIIKQFCVIS